MAHDDQSMRRQIIMNNSTPVSLRVNNIPAELRAIPQWAIAGPDKSPQLVNGKLYPASIHNSEFYDFETACRYAKQYRSNIGFIIKESDPFTCIDLDVKDSTPTQTVKWFDDFAASSSSYVERSLSGKGYHIWIKGKLPNGKGKKKNGIELYSQDRFIVFTGDVVINKPIEEEQDVIDGLLHENWGESFVHTPPALPCPDQSQTESDDTIMERAWTAENAQKFIALWEGNWQGYPEYLEGARPDHSRADMGLLSMLACYSKSNEQCKRLFLNSALGQRNKAKRKDYLDRTLERIRQKETLDNATVEQFRQGSLTVKKESTKLALPPGNMGNLTSTLYSMSRRPIWEVSICSALALVAGICGKTFATPTLCGLNLYLLLLAKTGVGKNEMHKTIQQLTGEVYSKAENLEQEKFIAPQEFVSGQALCRVLSEINGSTVSLTPEIGGQLLLFLKEKELQKNPNAPLHRAKWLEYYDSGPNIKSNGREFADSGKKINSFNSAYSIAGEMTPGNFFDNLSASSMEVGLISRFILIDYKGDRPRSNKNICEPQAEAITLIYNLMKLCATRQKTHPYTKLNITSDAETILDDFDMHCDDLINATDNDAIRGTWNRAHQNALRITSNIAVLDSIPIDRVLSGWDDIVGFPTPTINHIHAQWAIDFATHTANIFNKRLKAGDAGDGDDAREAKVLSIMKDVISGKTKLHKKRREELLEKEGAITHEFLCQRTANIAAFKNHPAKANKALTETLRNLQHSGMIQEIYPTVLMDKYQYTGKAYNLLKDL